MRTRCRYMNVHGGTSLMAAGLMDLSTFTVDNVNDIAWQTIGRFFRAHSSLYEGKVLTLPLAGVFVSLFYREDIFTSRGVAVPRTLEEYVLASQELNGTDLNGDGVPDFGSCFPWVGDYSSEYFFDLDHSGTAVSRDFSGDHSSHGHLEAYAGQYGGAGGHETLEGSGRPSQG